MEEDLELRQNFISMDRRIARNSYGTFFKIGDIIGHEGASDDQSAFITKFTIDKRNEEIKVYTTRGTCHLDFIYHYEEV